MNASSTIIRFTGVAVWVLLPSLGVGQEPSEDLSKKPITTAEGKLGDLLRQWWEDGTAAGNVGDFYDNRDGGHSPLDMGPYPQLQKIRYSPEDVKARKHWAAQHVILPHVVFGNSSTSAPPQLGGSNPRHYYVNPKGLAFLYEQYTKNNIYIYPEHRDHDPGHNGPGEGFGDLYPTNTPYLLISQGSSGSDQPFMRALPFTLAAFRPEVKKKLVETGLLMPTVQMILRRTNKQLKGADEYLSGKAHPSVFEGGWVDELGMAQMAHDMTAKTIPPLVQLKVIEEDAATPGKDFCERPAVTEKLADTPCVIARIWRGKEHTRRIIVSAEGSFDVNKRPLTFHWVILRGDPERIAIKPLNKEKSKAEIVVKYHERRPISPGAALESNRADIGVFVSNGAYHSAPGFITYYSLDSEARTYDAKGRILEIGHGAGEVALKATDWPRLFQASLTKDAVGKLLALSAEQKKAVQEVADSYDLQEGFVAVARKIWQAAAAERHKAVMAEKAARERQATALKAHQAKPSAETKADLDRAAREVDIAEAVRKNTEVPFQAAQTKHNAATADLARILDRSNDDLSPSPRNFFDKIFDRLIRDPVFLNDHAAWVADALKKSDKAAKARYHAARKKLVALGVVKNPEGLPLKLQPLRTGADEKSTLSGYEKSRLAGLNALALSDLLMPGILAIVERPNYVDWRLSAARNWRDVYRYDETGHYLGWARFTDTGATAFNPDGFIVMKKDGLGRCILARTVRYVQDPPPKPAPNFNPLRQVPGAELVEYEFTNDRDFRGRIKSKRPADDL